MSLIWEMEILVAVSITFWFVCNCYHNLLESWIGSIASAKVLSATIWTSAAGFVGGDDYQ